MLVYYIFTCTYILTASLILAYIQYKLNLKVNQLKDQQEDFAYKFENALDKILKRLK